MNRFSSETRSIFTVILVLLVVYWGWWLPGPRVANDYPNTSQDTLNSLMDLPRAWSSRYSEGMGEYSVFTLWSWPISFLSGLLANGGLNFDLIERLVFILPFIIVGTLGIWKFLERLNLSNPARIIASIFYLLNTYILLVIDGGQLMIALAYAWFPIAYLTIDNSLKGGMVKRILAGLSVWVLGFLDIRFIYILLLLTVARFLYEFIFIEKKDQLVQWTTNWLKTGFAAGIIALVLNAYWIITILKYPLPADEYNRLTQASFSNFYNLGHSLLLISPHWHENAFGKITPLKWEFILIPIASFLALLLRRYDKLVGFWTLVALISVFLAKGFSPPFPQVYQWFFENIPGFTLFRDSTKFFFLTSLSYSVLIGITVNESIKRFHTKKAVIIFSTLVILYLLVLVRPVWLGQMTGTFLIQNENNEYLQIKDLLQKDNTFSRVLWIPATIPLTYTDTSHPIVEARRIFSTRPFASGIVGSYEVFNFLREAPFMGELFDITGVGYIVYSFEEGKKSAEAYNYYQIFSQQLSNLKWLTKIPDLNISTFKTKESQERFFLASNLWGVIGSDEILNESTKSASLSLSRNALVFIQNDQSLIYKINDVPFVKIILLEKELTDLSASFIPQKNIYFPSMDLPSSPGQNGWWKRESADFLWWRNFIQQKYKLDNQDYYLGGGLAISEDEDELVLSRNKLSEGDLLLARVMVSPKSGVISFYQDDRFGEINTKMDLGKRFIKLTGNEEFLDRVFDYDRTNFKWFVVGNINNLPIRIKTSGDINVINALSVVSVEEWKRYLKAAEEIKSSDMIKAFQEENVDLHEGKIYFEKVNPTKYRIKVEGLEKPSVLVFNEKYDPKWMLNNKSPIILYNLLNGYIVENGEYTLEFEPQKYVNVGLGISFISLLVISFLILRLKSKYNK